MVAPEISEANYQTLICVFYRRLIELQHLNVDKWDRSKHPSIINETCSVQRNGYYLAEFNPMTIWVKLEIETFSGYVLGGAILK